MIASRIHRFFCVPLLVVILLCAAVRAESPDVDWVVDLGGSQNDDFRMGIIGHDGNFIAVGYAHGQNGQIPATMYAAKLTPEGELVWERWYHEAGFLKAKDIYALDGGGYVISGYTLSGIEWQGVVLWIDEAGVELNRVVFGSPYRNEVAWRVRPHPDGGFVVTGTSLSRSDDDRDGFLLRLDEDGTELWSHLYGGEEEERVTAMTVADNGDILMAGLTRTLAPTGWGDVWIVRTDQAGEVLWERHFGGLAEEEAYWIEPLPENRFLLTGEWASLTGGQDVFALTIDANGDSLSGFVHPTEGSADWGQMILPHPTGGYVITGNKTGTGEGHNVLVARYAEDGDVIWEYTDGGFGHDRGYGIRHLDDGGYMIAGVITPSVDLASQAFMMRMTPDGNPVDEDWGDYGASPPNSPGLLHVYPNPFNSSATVLVTLARPSRVTVELLDVLGRQVARVYEGELAVGRAEFSVGGEELPSGLYFVRVLQEQARWTRRVMLVR